MNAICSGKFGDIVQILPILYHEFKKTGEIQTVITSEKYGELFSACSYVNKVLSPEKWGSLSETIKWSKERYEEVKILQCHGDKFPFDQTQKSFQQEVYLRAGLLHEWDKLELVFDQRDEKRERTLISANIPRGKGQGRPFAKYILLGDVSESSPFDKIEELATLLQVNFGQEYRIIRLSIIKADKIYDLLGLYDKAAALVTIETVHVHLSQASKVPTFVLAIDGWRGSAFRKKFGFYMNYSEWSERSGELIEAIKNNLVKKEPMKVIQFQTAQNNGYNLSMIDFQGKRYFTYRYHFGGWKTRLAITGSDGNDLELMVDPLIEQFSREDLRLFILEGKLHGAYTVSNANGNEFMCYMAYGEITKDESGYKISHIQIKRQGNDFTGTTKNWTPFVIENRLYLIYGISGTNQIVLEIHGNQVLAEHSSPAPQWGYGQIRGGAVIARGDTLLRFFHSRQQYANKSFRYFVGAAIMEGRAPFKTLAISKIPILRGDGEFFPNCKHWKNNVSIAYGSIQEGDKILLSIGKNDCRCLVYELQESDLNL